MSVKLRLDYFLMRGGLLVKGDACFNTVNNKKNKFESVIGRREAFAGQYNFSGAGFGVYADDELKVLTVESFAPRKNNGSQPEPDDFPVVVDYNNRATLSVAVNKIIWHKKHLVHVKSWKPDIEKLIEQQIEHDKQQEKGEMCEVDAIGQLKELFELVSGCEVSDFDSSQIPFLADYIQGQMEADNKCIESLKETISEQQIEYDKAKLKEQFKNGPQGIVEGLEQPIEELMINAKGNGMPIFTQEMKDTGKYAPIDSKVRIVNNSGLDLEYGEDILGLKVTVKSEPISIGKGNIIQVVEYENIAYCFETDMIFPFKSQEEIEMEEAKEKQIARLACKYAGQYSCGAEAIDQFTKMQLDGELAEIILPLEGN